MSNEAVIQYCAPTLAGIKTGSLFNTGCEDTVELRNWIRSMNRILGKKGIRILPFSNPKGHVLIYLYRPSQLSEDLKDAVACNLLKECGYCGKDPNQCVAYLAKRLQESMEFPHEIGLFLGYPPVDVRGFIDNKARNSKHTGVWKVYGDVEKAQETFDSYKRCTRRYWERWQKDPDLEKLAVMIS